MTLFWTSLAFTSTAVVVVTTAAIAKARKSFYMKKVREVLASPYTS